MNKLKPEHHQEQFDRWMAEYLPVLHHVARAFATGADRDDLLQEMMLSLWKAVPYYRGNSKPSTFIYKVSHNTALTWVRTEKRRRVSTADLEDFHALPAPSVDPATADQLEMLYAAIRRLPELDRSLILLQLDGLGYEEMAGIHGLSISNVGVRLNRIRTRLIQDIQGEEER